MAAIEVAALVVVIALTLAAMVVIQAAAVAVNKATALDLAVMAIIEAAALKVVALANLKRWGPFTSLLLHQFHKEKHCRLL
jgi:hypothetical protein